MLQLLLIAALSFPVQTDSPAPIKPLKVSYLSAKGVLSKQSDLHIELMNLSEKPIKSVEIQFDVIDRTRGIMQDRLFIEVSDWGLGDRSIKPGKSKLFTVPVTYRLPRGVGDGYGTYSCDDCVIVNVVHFKDGSTWERKGWRDEANPNR